MLPVLHGERLTLRPLSEEHLDALVERCWGSERAALVGHGRRPGRRCARTCATTATRSRSRSTASVAGWLGVVEENEPDYRHAALDIGLGPEHQGRGLGSEALRRVIRWLIGERGHHRFTIDPAVANERAIRAYAAVGFRPVGVLRRYERGPDGTLGGRPADGPAGGGAAIALAAAVGRRGCAFAQATMFFESWIASPSSARAPEPRLPRQPLDLPCGRG